MPPPKYEWRVSRDSLLDVSPAPPVAVAVVVDIEVVPVVVAVATIPGGGTIGAAEVATVGGGREG